MSKLPKRKLFEQLADPDASGISRWIQITEFVDEYKDLAFNNGGSWCRTESISKSPYNYEFQRLKQSLTSKIIAIRLNGLKEKGCETRQIRKDIIDEFKNRCCVVSGATTQIEIDH